MTSGDRPAATKKSIEPTTATSKESKGATALIRDDISEALTEMTDRTFEKASQSRELDIMTFKLHLILKKLMARNNESARSAAKAIGIPISTFSGYLKPNKRQIDPQHLLAIARHYSVSIDYLFGSQQKMKLDNLPTKRIFSKWVRLTLEEIEELEGAADKDDNGAGI